MKWRYVVAVWLLALVSWSFLGRALDEEKVAQRMASEVRHFAEAHGGRAPVSWEELGPASEVKAAARERYAFLAKPVPFVVASGEEREAVIVMRSPMHEYVEPASQTFHGRYMIARTRTWETGPYFDDEFYDEAWVQKIFREAGVALPAPEAEWRGWREPLVMLYTVAAWAAIGLGALLAVKFGTMLLRLMMAGRWSRPRPTADGKPGRVWDY